MRHYRSCPASNVSAQMTGMMAVVASGAARMVDGMRAAGAQAREASVHQSYADALSQHGVGKPAAGRPDRERPQARERPALDP
jgi:hypothetical protein